MIDYSVYMTSNPMDEDALQWRTDVRRCANQ